MKTEQDEKMHTYAEVAWRFNCSVMTIRRAVKDGTLHPVIRINRQVVRIPESSVVKFEERVKQNIANAIR